MKSEHKFYCKGIDNQKRPDFSATFYRVDTTKLPKLDRNTKKYLRDYLKSVERSYKYFVENIQSVL